MKPSSHFGSKFNFHRKVTSFVVSYIDNITLPNVSENILMINLKDYLPQTNQYIYYGDFNINLLHTETSCYAQDFLLSLQSFSFISTIDKPTRVCNNSATLIDNILTNKVDVVITSGNIISDISNHYSQFCISQYFIQSQNAESKNAETFLVISGAGLTLNSLMLW